MGMSLHIGNSRSAAKNEQQASRCREAGAHYQTNPGAKPLSKSHIKFCRIKYLHASAIAIRQKIQSYIYD